MSTDPLLGRQLANFRIERLLGHGGMATVYYGWDVKLKRPVAIKVIDARFRDNPTYAQRFVREAQAVSTWRHQHIAQVYYADNEGDLYYFVMEFIDGLDLGKLLAVYAERGELMPATDVLRIGHAVAEALDYAHRKGIIHRDVKPSNVILGREGQVVLSDFGLALDVQEGSRGEVFGSAHYIAPEQARRSSDAVPQSDLYSFGVMLYEMLTGAVPFDDPSPTTVALQHLTVKPPPPREINPDLSPAVESVLLKALDKTYTERYQTGQALMAALESALKTTQPVTKEPLRLPPPPAGVSAPPRLSQLTVADLLSQQTPIESVASPSKKSSPPSRQPLTKNPVLWLMFGGCALFLLVGMLLGGGLLATQWGVLFKPTASSTLAASTSAKTAVASPTIPPGATATSSPATNSPMPEVTSPPSPETQTTESPTVAPAPTIKYPTGKRLMLYYDENSFYLLNLSESNFSISSIALERLDASDVPLNRFEGSRWAKFSSTSRPGWCLAIEILSSPAMRPAQCLNKYLSTRTPTRDDPVIFWTTQAGSHQFRVLWKDEEVARCEIGAGECEVFVP